MGSEMCIRDRRQVFPSQAGTAAAAAGIDINSIVACLLCFPLCLCIPTGALVVLCLYCVGDRRKNNTFSNNGCLYHAITTITPRLWAHGPSKKRAFREGHTQHRIFQARLLDNQEGSNIKPYASPLAPNFSASALYANRGDCLLYTSPSPRDGLLSRMPSSA